jgi:hypothetical protein
VSEEKLPAVIPQPTGWEPIDQAPRDRPALFFCPYVHSPDGTGAHPDARAAHGRVVGWWSEEEKHWVAGILQGTVQRIYPSRWAELLDEPETKGAKT